MSLTQAEEVFASIDQAGVNDLLKAFFTARSRYLTYGTPLFVPTTTTSATAIPALSFPGILGGLEFEVSFAIPSVDINPDDSGVGLRVIRTEGLDRELCSDGSFWL